MIALLAVAGAIIVGLVLAWRAPIVFVALILVGAGLRGGALILVAAPLCVFGAARYLAISRSVDFDRRRYGETAMVMLATFVIGLLTASMTLDRSQSGGGGGEGGNQGAQPPPEFARQQDGEGLIQRFVRWLTGSKPGTAPSNQGEAATAQNPPNDPNWWFLVVVAAVVIAAVVAWLLYRRWKRRTIEGDRPWSLERMEKLGRKVGRKREPHEGALSFGSALAGHVRDPRLGEVGRVVSADVYQSREVGRADVDGWLGAVEADPPSRPKRSITRRVVAGAISFVQRPFRR